MRFDRCSCMLMMLLWAAVSCSRTEDPTPAPPPVVNKGTSTTEEPGSDTTAATGEYHEYKVLAHDTDSAITTSEEPHYAYLDTRVSLRNKLLLFLGGTNTFPKYFTEFSKTAAALGYHVVNVQYPNAVTVRVCADAEEMECFTRYHDAVIDGGTHSDFIRVTEANGIMNRVMKLLKYLEAQDTSQGWDQFYAGDVLQWSKVVVAGHSQGGDHAAYLAYKYAVDRLIVLCSPNDFSRRYNRPADWCGEPFATSSDRIFGLMHKRDELVPPEEHYAAWKAMRMLAAGDTTAADRDSYKGAHALYTDVEPNPSAGKYKSRHNAPIIDEAIPAGASGDHLKHVWKYLLGAAGSSE